MDRDRRIDTLRGLLITIMLINHIGGYFKLFTWQPFGYVSAAEGFIFLSGFVCAKVHKKYANDFNLLSLKMLKRSFKIYGYHMVIALFLCLLVIIIPQYLAAVGDVNTIYHSNPIKTVILYSLLCYQPQYMCILPMYSIFFILCPILLYLIYHGRAGITLSLSLVIWFIGQFIDPINYIDSLLGPYYQSMHFNLFSWQLVFVIGLYLGNSNRALSAISNNKFAFKFIIFICLVFICFRHSGMSINYNLLNDRERLPFYRLMNFSFLIVPLWYYLRKLPRTFFIPYIEYFGRYSLLSFSLSIVFHYLFYPIEWRVEKFGGMPGMTMFCVFCIVTSYFTVYVINHFIRLQQPIAKVV